MRDKTILMIRGEIVLVQLSLREYLFLELAISR